MKRVMKPIMFLSMVLAVMSLTTVSCTDDDVTNEPEQPANKECKYIVDANGKITPKSIQQISVEEFNKSIMGSALAVSEHYAIDKDGALDSTSKRNRTIPDILVQNDSITYYYSNHTYRKCLCTYSNNIMYYGVQKDVEFQIISFNSNELVVLDDTRKSEITYKCLKGAELESFINQHEDYTPEPSGIYPSIDS